jgi:hypothetical protein
MQERDILPLVLWLGIMPFVSRRSVTPIVLKRYILLFVPQGGIRLLFGYLRRFARVPQRGIGPLPPSARAVVVTRAGLPLKSVGPFMAQGGGRRFGRRRGVGMKL